MVQNYQLLGNILFYEVYSVGALLRDIALPPLQFFADYQLTV